ncbi:ribosome-associated translation inhibitor RaiA [bacterium]|nr:ribosome-associated translation inhibitor RaiA [bacterium]
MRVIIKATNIELTLSLRTFIEKKIGEVEKFLEDVLKKIDTFDGKKPRTEAFVEIGKLSRHHKKGNIFYAECQIPLPGVGVRSESEREDLRLAIVEVKDELQRLLKKYKNRQAAREKRQRRKTKKDIKLSKRARFYRKGRIREEGI